MALFKEITQQLRLIPDVVASVITFADEVAEAFVSRASRVMKGGETLAAAAVVVVQIAVARLLESSRDHLEATERAHRIELRKESEIRRRRDQESDALYRELLDTRSTLDGAYGQGTSVRLLGLDPGLGSLEPPLLGRYGREAVDLLSAPDFELPGVSSSSSPTKTPLEFAAAIRSPLERLESTLDELALQKRLTQKALKAKTRALEAGRKTFVYGSRMIEALYVLAGEDFHSVRLRPRVSSGPGEAEPKPLIVAPRDEPTDEEGEETPAETQAETPAEALAETQAETPDDKPAEAPATAEEAEPASPPG